MELRAAAAGRIALQHLGCCRRGASSKNIDFSPHPPKVRILLRTLCFLLKFPSPKGLISGRERTTLANERRGKQRVISAAAKISHAIFPDSTLIMMKEQDGFWFFTEEACGGGKGEGALKEMRVECKAGCHRGLMYTLKEGGKRPPHGPGSRPPWRRSGPLFAGRGEPGIGRAGRAELSQLLGAGFLLPLCGVSCDFNPEPWRAGWGGV